MRSQTVQPRVRPIEPSDIERCAEILESVRPWFGLEDANRTFLAELRSLPSAGAVVGGTVVGFISLSTYSPRAAEIRVMAVERSRHRQGLGRALLAWAELWCEERGICWLHVKTLGPSTPDEGYELTRHFYVAMGFEPLFESRTMWGPDNTALILAKHLTCLPRSPS